MDYTGKKVRHAVFGEGKIVRQESNYIWVIFPRRAGEMKFVTPDCFQKFLTLLDVSSATVAQGELEEKLARHRQNDEEERRREAALRPASKPAPPLPGGTFPKVPNYSNPKAFFDDQAEALENEIKFLRSHGSKKITIHNGELIERRRETYVYAFESEVEINLPDDTQITLWRGNNATGGTLLACEEATLYIASEEDLGSHVETIEFSAQAWQLMSFLVDRLQSLSKSPTNLVRTLIMDGLKQARYGESIRRGPEAAMKMALTQPICFIWGPPGTGKTETLSRIALKLIAQHKRVLMLSYSNISVDGAALRTLHNDPDPIPGRIVRYGYPRDKAVSTHEYLSSYNLVIRAHPELKAERDKLNAERKQLSPSSPRALEIQERLKKIRKQLSDEEKKAVAQASFVATTVSKAIADSSLYESKFDAVIFDEASMAYVPQIIFAASLASEHFICIGDFEQLPPIVQSGDDVSLNVDIFRYCGIAGAVEKGQGHDWLCMLDKQHRMHPDIANFASGSIYHGLLRTADDIVEKTDAIAQDPPFAGKSMALADLSGMMSVCRKTADKSRVNVLSALISMGLAITAARKHDVGLITPYHAQSRLLHAMVLDIGERQNPTQSGFAKHDGWVSAVSSVQTATDDYEAPTDGSHSIKCATVHQFQGSEQEVIIFDAVDCYFMPYPGILLTSDKNDSANRLFNVALSRAKGKFIVVANVDYLKKGLPKRLMLRELLDTLRGDSSAYRAGEKLKHEVPRELDSQSGAVTSTQELGLDPGKRELYSWFDEKTGETAFIEDLRAARKSIRIDIPGPCALSDEQAKQLAQLLDRAVARGVELSLRTPEPAKLPQALRRMAYSYKYVSDPVTIIDQRLSWYGEPASAAKFQSQGRDIPTRWRPIIRFEGSHFARALTGMLAMDRGTTLNMSSADQENGLYPSFSAWVEGELSCPECGRHMKLRRSSRKGRGTNFFLGCSGYPNCEHTERLEPDILDAYFYFHNENGKKCPYDGTSLVADVGRYGLYIHCCCANGDHHKFKPDRI